MLSLKKLAALAVCLPGLLLAQLDRGAMVGTVTDPTTAVVPGAKLQVRNVATGAIYQAETNMNGQYSVPNLPIGDYAITFEAAGFKKLVRSNLDVRVADTLRVDVSLEVGSTSESIEITAEAPRLQTDTPLVGT